MTSRRTGTRTEPTQVQRQRPADQNIDQARKEELFRTYESVFEATWNHFEAVLGKTIMKEEAGVRCLTLTQKSHPMAKSLRLTDSGVSFEGLCQQMHTVELEELRGVFEELFGNLISIATEIIFDIFNTAR
jgi:hypothetical protein